MPMSSRTSGSTQTARLCTTRPPSRRTAAAAEADDDLAVDLAGLPCPDHHQAPGRQLAACGERRRIAFPGQLLEAGQRPELAAGTPVELVERALERRVTDDRDDEDVGLDVPWLVGDGAKLHGGVILPRVRPRCPRGGGHRYVAAV